MFPEGGVKYINPNSDNKDGENILKSWQPIQKSVRDDEAKGWDIIIKIAHSFTEKQKQKSRCRTKSFEKTKCR